MISFTIIQLFRTILEKMLKHTSFQYFPILLLSRYKYSIASYVLTTPHKIIVALCNGRLSNILLPVTHTNVSRIFCLAVGGVAAQEDIVTIFHKRQQQELGPCENIFSHQLQTYSKMPGEEIFCFFLLFWSRMYLICTYLLASGIVIKKIIHENMVATAHIISHFQQFHYSCTGQAMFLDGIFIFRMF